MSGTVTKNTSLCSRFLMFLLHMEMFILLLGYSVVTAWSVFVLWDQARDRFVTTLEKDVQRSQARVQECKAVVGTIFKHF
jgi:hypothetical protein